MERVKQFPERKGMLLLPERWREFLSNSGETGMGYQTGNVTLKDGSIYIDVAFMNPYITEIRSRVKGDFPFTADDIEKIELTHRRWKWEW